MTVEEHAQRIEDRLRQRQRDVKMGKDVPTAGAVIESGLRELVNDLAAEMLAYPQRAEKPAED